MVKTGEIDMEIFTVSAGEVVRRRREIGVGEDEALTSSQSVWSLPDSATNNHVTRCRSMRRQPCVSESELTVGRYSLFTLRRSHFHSEWALLRMDRLYWQVKSPTLVDAMISTHVAIVYHTCAILSVYHPPAYQPCRRQVPPVVVPDRVIKNIITLKQKLLESFYRNFLSLPCSLS